jgi:hypothetical protein
MEQMVKQMMERLLAEIRTNQEKIEAGDEKVEVLREKNVDHSRGDERQPRGATRKRRLFWRPVLKRRRQIQKK